MFISRRVKHQIMLACKTAFFTAIPVAAVWALFNSKVITYNATAIKYLFETAEFYSSNAGPLISLIIAICGLISTVIGVSAARQAATLNRAWIIAPEMTMSLHEFDKDGQKKCGLEYTLTVENAGNSPAEGVLVKVKARMITNSTQAFKGRGGISGMVKHRALEHKLAVIGSKNTKIVMGFIDDDEIEGGTALGFGQQATGQHASGMWIFANIQYRPLGSGSLKWYDCVFLFISSPRAQNKDGSFTAEPYVFR